MASSLPSVLIDEEVAFDRDLHAYRDSDGTRRMSVTQSLVIAGLIDFSMVPAPVLQAAQQRGTLVHQACAIVDRGDSLEDYAVPPELENYVEAYLTFQREMRFLPDPEWIERPMIVELFGHRVGMTPDAVGTIAGVPTLLERKTSRSRHVAWKLQTGGYELGLKAAGLQIRQRFALQLFANRTYKLDPHDDPGDLDSFGDFYRSAAWKLKHRLAELV